MPKISIPGLASLPTSEAGGFGSSVIAPNLPSLANLQRANFYGTAYADVEDDGDTRFFDTISGLPTGISVVADGLELAGNRPDLPKTALDGIEEPWEGTVFFFFTPFPVTIQ